MEKRPWYKKFAWVTTLDLMYWHRGNVVYNLYQVIGNLNWQTAPEKYQNELVKQIETATHVTSKALLVTILSDLYFKIGLKNKAINLLRIMPHERRRFYAFLKLAHQLNVSEVKSHFNEFLKYISNKDDRKIALELKQARRVIIKPI